MPTNILRNRARAAARPDRDDASMPATARREIFIHAGRVVIRARLLATATADRIWATLPIYSTAETWGQAIHFETRVETGRERGAKWNITAGELAFWVEQDRIILGFGPTPLSRPGEIRMPSPCNVFAVALDDLAGLASVQPGQKIAVLEAAS